MGIFYQAIVRLSPQSKRGSEDMSQKNHRSRNTTQDRHPKERHRFPTAPSYGPLFRFLNFKLFDPTKLFKRQTKESPETV